jgi:NADP-dependent 3-hydroxy acid dehydrogenase YdfG
MAFANISTLFEVEGRIALVTGGSSGLGFMIAQVKKIVIFSASCVDYDRASSQMAQKFTSRL